jgi:hypothetical protein
MNQLGLDVDGSREVIIIEAVSSTKEQPEEPNQL